MQPDLIVDKQIDLTPGKIFGSPIIDIKSGDYKFVQLFVETASEAKLALTWTAPTNSQVNLEKAVIASCDQKSKSFIFPLSEHKSWILTDIVHRLFIVIASGNSSVRINQLRLLRGNDLIPNLRHHDFAEGYLSPDGIFISLKNEKFQSGLQLVKYKWCKIGSP